MIVKGRVEKTYISDIISFIEYMWSPKKAVICISVDMEALSGMYLGLSVHNIANSILLNKKLKINKDHVSIQDKFIFIDVYHNQGGLPNGRGASAKSKVSINEGGSDLLLRVNHLKRSIPLIVVSGYPDANRAVIEKSQRMDEKTGKYSHKVMVEGYGLRACMNTEGVIGTKAWTNSVMETRDVLGIEAARSTIAKEIQIVMKDLNVDPRHLQLLADVMTYKGEVLGITRFGLSKMRDSVLQLASFEKTPDHLFEAAAGMKTDKIEGVSESIIMGQTMSVGTGAFKVVRKLHFEPEGIQVKPKPTAFETAWKWDQRVRANEQRQLG
jgi:DNA-directed RNA polymerase III subunit RPC1